MLGLAMRLALASRIWQPRWCAVPILGLRSLVCFSCSDAFYHCHENRPRCWEIQFADPSSKIGDIWNKATLANFPGPPAGV